MSQPLGHLHRSQNKAEVYQSAAPLRWCAERRCWQTFDPDILLAIFKNANFEVCDYESEIMRIIDGPGVDLLATAAVARHLPLAKEGCTHAALRKRMALRISETAAPAVSQLDEFTRREVRRVFSRPREFDVVAELFAPLVANLVSSLSGVRVDNCTGETSPSQLFDRRLSLNRRKLVNSQIIELYGEATTPAGSDAEAPGSHLDVALAVLGADAMLGSIGESFICEIRAHPHTPMSEIDWSDGLPATGVPYVDRVAVQAVEIGGCRIEAGQRIRLYLDALKHSEAKDQSLYFGGGRHACLGRVIAQKCWRILTGHLRSISRTVTIERVVYRPWDGVFNCPISVKVTVGEQ